MADLVQANKERVSKIQEKIKKLQLEEKRRIEQIAREEKKRRAQKLDLIGTMLEEEGFEELNVDLLREVVRAGKVSIVNDQVSEKAGLSISEVDS